jgi:hypothetical protein
MTKIGTTIDTNSLKKITTIGGVVAVVVVAFYVTGLYRNLLEINKLKYDGATLIKRKKPE